MVIKNEKGHVLFVGVSDTTRNGCRFVDCLWVFGDQIGKVRVEECPGGTPFLRKYIQEFNALGIAPRALLYASGAIQGIKINQKNVYTISNGEAKLLPQWRIIGGKEIDEGVDLRQFSYDVWVVKPGRYITFRTTIGDASEVGVKHVDAPIPEGIGGNADFWKEFSRIVSLYERIDSPATSYYRQRLTEGTFDILGRRVTVKWIDRGWEVSVEGVSGSVKIRNVFIRIPMERNLFLWDLFLCKQGFLI